MISLVVFIIAVKIVISRLLFFITVCRNCRGLCHLPCKRSVIQANATSGYLTPSLRAYHSMEVLADTYPNFTSCLWTLTSTGENYDDLIYRRENGSSNILLTILVHSFSCFDSRLYVYDGVPSNPQSTQVNLPSSFRLIATVCDNKKGIHQFRSTTGVLTVFYEGKAGDLAKYENLGKKEGFLAKYQVLRCPDNCPSPFVCREKGTISICTCTQGYFGERCEHEICPGNCNSAKRQGVCNQVRDCFHICLNEFKRIN